ncbi:MAG TPA: hypothetical protein DIW17_09010 [Clostridiales bacterium]|nr:hypothetical protein [Clostridiales bacterium]
MKLQAKDSIKFNVLVPVFNVENYIRTCIESVLNQTFDNFCLVLVDDGTPDRSGEICDDYARMDDRIKVIHQANKGSLAARRVAIDYVLTQDRGDQQYIVFLDSDDSLKPKALETIYDTIMQYHCDMVVFGMNRVHNGKTLHSRNEVKEFSGSITSKRFLYNLVFKNSAYNSLCRKAVNLRLFSDQDYTEYYSIRHAEDLLQSIELYKNSDKVVFIPDKLYNYTVNPASITQSIKYGNYKVNSTVRSRVYNFLLGESIWAKDDYDHYLSYCQGLLNSEIKMISRFETITTNKLELLRIITEDDYYSMLLKKAGPMKPLLYLLNKRKYHQVLRILTLQSSVRIFVKKTLRQKEKNAN